MYHLLTRYNFVGEQLSPVPCSCTYDDAQTLVEAIHA